MAVPFDRIPDSLGYLVLTEDGAVSGGDLENKEDVANQFMNIIQTALRIPLSSSKKDKFKKLSIVWDNFMYVITISAHKIYICKRRFIPPDAAMA
ncbi:LTOR4-like protein [Mya arenaria]|uniref:Late endosomal/lysosomal adaptor and MAPK and MTOR activator 4 n=1 Tax=Mya arenaria TaxID=6604 RepID=A0ABY7FYN4_MYAAR|nr:LTOR4-like protein [Mya arenaria]